MREAALGDICEFKYGQSLPAKSRVEGAFPVFGSNGPVGSHIKAITKAPTIVVGRKGSVGELHYSEKPCWPIDTTYYVDPTTSEADLRWLYHAMKSLRLTELNKAAAVPGLNRFDAYKQRILVPDITSQRRIAAILDKADGIRRKREHALAMAGKLLQSTFLKMFGDPKRNPRGFDVIPLSSLLKAGLRNGVSPSSKGTVAAEVLTLSAITGDRFDGSHRKNGNFLTPIAESDQVHPDDFYICRGNGSPELVGKGFFADASMPGVAFPDTMIAARPDLERVSRGYLEAIWATPFVRDQIVNSARTTNGTHKINQAAAGAIVFPVPPISEQRKFDRLVEKVRSVQRKLSADSLLFEALSNRAFRGEL